MPVIFVLDSGFSGERSVVSVGRYIKILKKEDNSDIYLAIQMETSGQ